MEILKKKKEKKEDIHVGIVISKEVSSFLSLYALVKGHTKSEIIRQLIKDWRSKIEETTPQKVLLKELKKHILEAWIDSPRRTKFDTFVGTLRIELKKKGIKRQHTDEIIKFLENEKNKKKSTKKAS